MTGILDGLGWTLLSVLRRNAKLTLFYKGQKGKANISIQDLVTPLKRLKQCKREFGSKEVTNICSV